MGLIVFVVVQWYSLRVLGVGGYLRRFTKPFELPLVARIVFIPLNMLEELVKPVTLALRLFGNIFAGRRHDRPYRELRAACSSPL